MKEIWQFARATYWKDAFADPTYTHTEYTHDNDYMCISQRSGRVIIAFKGSDDIQDWISNMITGIGDTEHKGFQESFNKFIPELNQYLADAPGLEIVVTGHSRGAALATQCAEFIADTLSLPCSCLAFASPRVGTKTFRNHYNKLPIDHTVIRNGWDIVTYLPTEILGYRHVGKSVRLKRPWYRKYSMTMRSLDHKSEAYDKSINKRG